MKTKIQNMLFHDESRLPLLGLVPSLGEVEELKKLEVALHARVERLETSNSTQVNGIELDNARTEREMLATALDWIQLQNNYRG